MNSRLFSITHESAHGFTVHSLVTIKMMSAHIMMSIELMKREDTSKEWQAFDTYGRMNGKQKNRRIATQIASLYFSHKS